MKLRIRSIISWLFATDSKMVLENRLLLSSVLISILITLVAIIISVFLSLPWFLTGTGILVFAILIILYRQIKFKYFRQIYVHIYIALCLVANAALWFFGGGLDSQNVIVLTLTFTLSLIIVQKNRKWIILVAYILLILLEFHAQRFHPWLISGYSTELSRWIDGLTTTLYTIVFLYLIIGFLLKNYNYERIKAERNEKSLQLLNRTLEKRVEERTQEILIKNHILRVAGKTALFGSWYFDLTEKVLYWSSEIKAIHEVPDDFVPSIEKNVTFFHPDHRERLYNIISGCIFNGTPFDEQAQIITPTGKIIWVRMTGEAERDSSGNIVKVIGSLQNIDSIKRTEEELRIAKLEAEIANNAKSRFLLNISHEFRTPLNAVIGYADLIESDKGKNTKSYTESIKTGGRRLLDMVNNILELIRAEKADIQLHREFIDAYEFFSGFESLFTGSTSEKGLKFKAELADDLPSMIFTDEARLSLVINNLLNNAIKFTDRGSVELRVWHKRNPDNDEKGTTELFIEVKDTGKGMSEEQLKIISGVFASDRTNTISDGIGIGLSLTHRILEIMNGTINVTSVPGTGSLFTISLHDLVYREYLKEVRHPAENKDDKAGSEKINKNGIIDYEGLIRELEGELLLTSRKFEIRQPMNEVRTFGQTLNILGNKHNCKLISEYGLELSEAADNFDIEGMLRLIRKYPENLGLLKN